MAVTSAEYQVNAFVHQYQIFRREVASTVARGKEWVKENESGGESAGYSEYFQEGGWILQAAFWFRPYGSWGRSTEQMLGRIIAHY